MWLLSTDRGELHYFASPDDVGDGYAILSHVWVTNGREPEQSFEDTKQLCQEIADTKSKDSPRDWSSQKIQGCCILAAKHGYRWLWVDTCCIDKTSSTELSEAINSMFRYYQRARVCYVYLYDVAVSQTDIADWHLAFLESRWHRRGWTLQELLAPEFVAFYSREWHPLGSKTDLAPLLERAASIPQSVLTLQTPLADVSVSQRMSWAAMRKTTRPEDEAYCLMGIFHVNMPLLYGEGSKAFLRLQEEIMKQSRDTTLFSWTHTWGAPLSLEYAARLHSSQGSDACTPGAHTHDADNIAMYLFAPSPSMFNFSSCQPMGFTLSQFQEVPHSSTEPMVSTVVESSGRYRSVDFPTFSATPYGVLAHIPVIEFQDAQVLVALLGWTTSSGRRYGLLLTRCPHSSQSSIHLYDIGIKGQRLVELDPQQTVRGFGLLDQPLPAPRWMDVCLLQKPALDDTGARAARSSLPLAVLTCGLTSPFRFMRRDLDSLQVGKKSGASTMNLHSISCGNLELPWTGLDCAMTFTFVIRAHGTLETYKPGQLPTEGWHLHDFREDVVLQIGCCSSWTSHYNGAHWAKIRLLSASSYLDPQEHPSDHDCSVDHIYDWPNWKKTTVIVPSSAASYEYCLDLSFSACPMNPTSLKGAISIVPLNVVPSASSRTVTESPRGSKLRHLERKSRGQNAFAFDVIPMGSWKYFEDEAPTPADTSRALEDYDMEDWV